MVTYELAERENQWSGESETILLRDGEQIASDCPYDCPEDATLNRHFSGLTAEVLRLGELANLMARELADSDWFVYDVLPNQSEQVQKLFGEFADRV